ncbi:MAG: hypothetical protein LUC38_05800, partial [Oscillospiraceae bacterium]|nr:hypothetical protein [Oscillospiraceae bacterium]
KQLTEGCDFAFGEIASAEATPVAGADHVGADIIRPGFSAGVVRADNIRPLQLAYGLTKP